MAGKSKLVVDFEIWTFFYNELGRESIKCLNGPMNMIEESWLHMLTHAFPKLACAVHTHLTKKFWPLKFLRWLAIHLGFISAS